MKTEVCTYEGKSVSFLIPDVAQDEATNMMVNATEMAAVFGKQVSEFKSNVGARKFIQACLKPENAIYLKSGDSRLTEDVLILAKPESGTWMHRVLALKFAGWLSPDFELWIHLTIEELLFGKLVKREASFERSFQLQKELDELETKVGKSVTDFERYLEVQKQLRYEVSYRQSLTN
jgi:hypothetical protein